jgi:hypothetical protein
VTGIVFGIMLISQNLHHWCKKIVHAGVLDAGIAENLDLIFPAE